MLQECLALPKEVAANGEEVAVERPTIVCLCGSTRFWWLFEEANLRETLAERIVLSVGCDTKSDAMLGLSMQMKARLDRLHLCKIDLADEILVLNPGGYIGESCSREISYAHSHCKRVRWFEPIAFYVFEVAGQGTCDCCERAAKWLRFGDGPVTGRCDWHAYVSLANADGREVPA